MVAAILWDIKTHTKGSTVWRTWSHFQEFPPPKRGHFSTLDVFSFVLKIEKKLLEKGVPFPGSATNGAGPRLLTFWMDPRRMALWLASKLIRSMSGSPGPFGTEFYVPLLILMMICILSFNVLCIYMCVCVVGACLFLLELCWCVQEILTHGVWFCFSFFCWDKLELANHANHISTI